MEPTTPLTIDLSRDFVERLAALSNAANRYVEIAVEILAVHLDVQLWESRATQLTSSDLDLDAAIPHDPKLIYAWLDNADDDFVPIAQLDPREPPLN
jgi:hypothetical protein